MFCFVGYGSITAPHTTPTHDGQGRQQIPNQPHAKGKRYQHTDGRTKQINKDDDVRGQRETAVSNDPPERLGGTEDIASTTI